MLKGDRRGIFPWNYQVLSKLKTERTIVLSEISKTWNKMWKGRKVITNFVYFQFSFEVKRQFIIDCLYFHFRDDLLLEKRTSIYCRVPVWDMTLFREKRWELRDSNPSFTFIQMLIQCRNNFRWILRNEIRTILNAKKTSCLSTPELYVVYILLSRY
jgi:hypothetical protein